MKYWDIFGKTPVPQLEGGDSNKDAGAFIDKLSRQNQILLAGLNEIKDYSYVSSEHEEALDDMQEIARDAVTGYTL